jgi:hypothetical protein
LLEWLMNASKAMIAKAMMLQVEASHYY